MATQTKVEPIDGPAQTSPSTAGASSRVIAAEQGGDVAAPVSGTGSVGPVASNLADDEDVSLDELMISDSNEGDDAPRETAEAPQAAVTADDVDDAEPPSVLGASAELEPSAGNPLEDDEAAALAAAAAAQEAAAQAAAEEADARSAAARRGADSAPPSRAAIDPPRPRNPSSAPAAHDASGPAAAAERMTAPPGPPELSPPSARAAVLVGEGELPSSPDDDAPMSVELEPPSVQLDGLSDAAAPEGESAGAPPAAAIAAAPGRDAPLPSFDIPEVDSARSSRDGRANARPLATPLSHLSEVAEEDDDDAVTHIGLPVVPEAPDYPHVPAGFQVADAGVAAMRGFDPDLSLADARRAATRIVPRIDPAQLEQRRATSDTNSALTSSGVRSEARAPWFSGLFKRSGPLAPAPDMLQPPRRRAGWLLDTVLPPLSLVLFGSGIGAGIMLLQPDRGAKAAQQTQAIQALAPTAKRPTTLAERAEAGEGDALFKITNMAPDERTSELTLALERGYQAQKQNEFKEFTKLLEAPGGMATPNLTTRFLGYATSPETMLAAFSHLLTWPGSTGPDVLYAVWEKAPGGNRAASLAQQLLHSGDQRNKATPALVTALDLRSATTCEDYLRVLPAVRRDGDQRCSATLRALKHTDGCGDDGQKDCFACLREGTLLDDALKAIEGRPAPQL
jgi:hypothetical protein